MTYQRNPYGSDDSITQPLTFRVSKNDLAVIAAAIPPGVTRSEWLRGAVLLLIGCLQPNSGQTVEQLTEMLRVVTGQEAA